MPGQRRNLGLLAAAALAPTLGSATETDCAGHEDIFNHYLGMHEVLFMERDTTRVGEFYAEEFISHNQDEGGGRRHQDDPRADDRNVGELQEAGPRAGAG